MLIYAVVNRYFHFNTSYVLISWSLKWPNTWNDFYRIFGHSISHKFCIPQGQMLIFLSAGLNLVAKVHFWCHFIFSRCPYPIWCMCLSMGVFSSDGTARCAAMHRMCCPLYSWTVMWCLPKALFPMKDELVSLASWGNWRHTPRCITSLNSSFHLLPDFCCLS